MTGLWVVVGLRVVVNLWVVVSWLVVSWLVVVVGLLVGLIGSGVVVFCRFVKAKLVVDLIGGGIVEDANISPLLVGLAVVTSDSPIV